MSNKISRKNAENLLEQGFITQEQFDNMVEAGVASTGVRAKRPAIYVPNSVKGEFLEKAYDSLEALAKEMGFDYETEIEDGGKATIYLSGAGKARETSDEEVDDGELVDEEVEV